MSTKRMSKKELDGFIKDFERVYEIANYPRRCKFCNEYAHKGYICNNCWQDENDDYKQILNEHIVYRLPNRVDATKITDKDKNNAVELMKKNRISLVDALTEIYEKKVSKNVGTT
jgi:hypothetical protein